MKEPNMYDIAPLPCLKRSKSIGVNHLSYRTEILNVSLRDVIQPVLDWQHSEYLSSVLNKERITKLLDYLC